MPRALAWLRLSRAAVGGQLTRRLAMARDVALEHRQQALAVGRVAGFDHQVEDQAALAGGQVELVTVLDLAAALDDDVGVGLEQADQLVAGRDRLARQDPTFGLRDDPLDQGLIVAHLGLPELDRQVGRRDQLCRRLVQIGQGDPGRLDELAIQLNPSGSAPGELDRPSSLLRRVLIPE